MDVINSTSIDSPVVYTNKMTIPVVTDSNAFSFVCVDDEMVVQHTATTHNDVDVVNTLMAAAANFSKMNDGLHSAIVHRKQTMIYYIMSISLAFRLELGLFDMLHTTIPRSAPVTTAAAPPVMAHLTAPIYTDSGEDAMQKSVAVTTKERVRRPRNQFIIYRQWMSAQLHEQNPGLTAGSISTIVSNAWKAEKPNVKAHFKGLADEEDRLHKLNHPGYRYQTRRNQVEYRYAPRRSSEIRRRAPRRPRVQNIANASPALHNSRVPIMGNPVVTSVSQQQPFPNLFPALFPALSQETTKVDNHTNHLVDTTHLFSGQITELMPDTCHFLPPLSQEGWTPSSSFQDDLASTPSPSSTEHDNSDVFWAAGMETDSSQILGQI